MSRKMVVKPCPFCARKVQHIDYRDTSRIRHFTDGSGRILPRSATGACARHQHQLYMAIRRANYRRALRQKALRQQNARQRMSSNPRLHGKA